VHRRPSTLASPRVVPTNLARRAPAPSLSARSRARFRLPVPHSSPLWSTQPRPNTSRARRRSSLRPPSPLRFDCSHTKPIYLAPKLYHPFSSSIEPLPGQIGAQNTAATIVAARSFAPPVELPLPALLSSIRAHGEVPRDLLLLPIPFPAQIPRRRCRNAAAPSWSPGCAAGARRGLLLREPGRPRRAPWGRGAPLAAVLPCPAAALAHSQQTRHATPPAMALVAMAWLCCPFATVVLSCEFVSFHVKLAKYINK